MSPTKSIIAVLFALGSAGALAQNGAQSPQQPPTGKPVSDSATYGPVLNPQSAPAATGQPAQNGAQAAGEARPQAQEERAGQPPVTGKQNEVDPSARPAPETVQPQTPARDPATVPSQTQQMQPRTEQEKQGRPERKNMNKDKQAQRRPGAVQRIDGTPRIVAPAPTLTPRTQAQAAPSPAGPTTSQVVGCVGSTCTDASGASYNAAGQGNTTVSSTGRPCTQNGVNMQCL